MGYTKVYGWYTGGIGWYTVPALKSNFHMFACSNPQKNGTSIEINLLSIIFPLNLKGEAKISTEINARSRVFRFNNLKEK